MFKRESCNFRHTTASGNRCKSTSDGNASGSQRPTALGDRCNDRRSKEQSFPLPQNRSQKNDVQTSHSRGESPAKRIGIPCRFGARCKYASCNFWYPPVPSLQNGSGCKYGRYCQFRHSDAEGTPSKKSMKESAKGSVAVLKEKVQVGCVSQDSYPKKFIPRKVGKVGSNASADTR